MKRLWNILHGWVNAAGERRGSKLIRSFILFMLSLSCFYYQPAGTTKTDTDVSKQGEAERTTSISSTKDGMGKFCETVGMGLLILAVWVWRKELAIKSLFGMEKEDPPEQQTGEQAKLPEDYVPPTPADLKSAASNVEGEMNINQVDHILNLLQHRHAINVAMIAQELVMTRTNAEKILLSLRRSGVLRADGVPRATIYTLAASVENLTLDKVREKVESTREILSERRFVRVRHAYDIDSILTCEDKTFIVEAKFLQSRQIVDRLDNWIMQLLAVAKEFSGKPVDCILAVVCMVGVDVEHIKQQVKAVTFASGSVPIQVLVFGEDEIRRKLVA